MNLKDVSFTWGAHFSWKCWKEHENKFVFNEAYILLFIPFKGSLTVMAKLLWRQYFFWWRQPSSFSSYFKSNDNLSSQMLRFLSPSLSTSEGVHYKSLVFFIWTLLVLTWCHNVAICWECALRTSTRGLGLDAKNYVRV